MNATLLDHGDVLHLHTAAISAGLGTKRVGLLSGLPPQFTDTLHKAVSNAEQLLTDLVALNAAVRLTDGTVPLVVWLNNAIAMAGLRLEAKTFELFRDKLSHVPIRDTHPATQSAGKHANVGGSWITTWHTIKNARTHTATLVIPTEHAHNFTATMTIEYFRMGQPTIVEETLAGIVWNRTVSLKGTSRKFIVQGTAHDYKLDYFSLSLSEDGQVLDGRASLTHGDRIVVLRRMPATYTTNTRVIAVDLRSQPEGSGLPHQYSPLAAWKDKLTYFQEQLAITADPARKFELKCLIQEAQHQIEKLQGQYHV